MNEQTVRSEIQNVINQLHSEIGGRAARKQYKPGKAQIAKLTELGIIDLMPAGFGFADADAVIAAATNARTAVMNTYGEGEEISASTLYQAIHEVEEVQTDEDEEQMSDEEFQDELAHQNIAVAIDRLDYAVNVIAADPALGGLTEVEALNEVLTAAEAAEIYGLTPIGIRKACERGSIEARKSAGTWLIRRADAEARWGKK